MVTPVAVMLFAVHKPLASTSGSIFSLGLMGVGILAAAATGRFWVGVRLALLNAGGLLVLAMTLGMAKPAHVVAAGAAMVVAGISFAARGALFTKTLSERAWLMALFVVAGEGSVLLIAAVFPGALPDWFLALLPAQWASMAILSAVTGAGVWVAAPPLIALAGTAATTLHAAKLRLRRWPYLLMFTVWLGLSSLVYFWHPPPI
ncbi:MAG: hypothetical protein AAF610_14380 [Pseudomonadota bacterium]